MAERLQILQNADFEGPGWLLDWASERGFSVAVCRAWEEPLPPPAERVIVLGAPESVRDLPKLPWLQREAEWLREALVRDAHVLGICLGAQLLARLLGGDVKDGPHAEIGWQPFTWSGNGTSFPLFQWHREVFTLPPGADPIAGSPATPLQGFRRGRVWALAGHPEVTPELAREYVRRCWSEKWYEALGEKRYVQQPREMEARASAEFQRGRPGVRALLDEWAK